MSSDEDARAAAAGGGGNGEEEEEEEEFSSSSSSSSDEDNEALHQMFVAIDMDGDGFVNLEEMVNMERGQSAARGSVFNELERRQELSKFLVQADLDRDQRLSFQEFIMAMRKRAQWDHMYDSEDSDALVSGPPVTQRLHSAPLVPPMPTRRRSQFAKRKSHSRRRRSRLSKQANMQDLPKFLQMAGVSALEYAAWVKDQDQHIDMETYDTRATLRQLFDAMDPEHTGTASLSAIQEFVDITHLEETKAEALAAAFEKASVDGELSHESFVATVSEMDITNGDLRDACESILWSKEEGKMGIAPMDMASIQTSMKLLRHQVVVRSSKPSASPRAAGSMTKSLQQTRKQLQLALRIAEDLELKYHESQKKVAHLQAQLNGDMSSRRSSCSSNAPPPVPSPPNLNAMLHSAVEQKTTMPAATTTAAAPAAPEATAAPAKPVVQRTHAERNQEFFLLTCLSVKLNIETKCKAAGLPPPRLPSTKVLYESAMKHQVPFQFYHQWLVKKLFPQKKKENNTLQVPSS